MYEESLSTVVRLYLRVYMYFYFIFFFKKKKKKNISKPHYHLVVELHPYTCNVCWTWLRIAQSSNVITIPSFFYDSSPCIVYIPIHLVVGSSKGCSRNLIM